MVKIKGGDSLDRALKELSSKLAKGAELEVGFLEGATYPNGTSVAMVAAIQEFGAPSRGIPPRPFFRTMVAQKSAGWPAALAQQIKASDFDASKALAKVGDGIKGQLQQAIVDFVGAPLAAATVKRKGFDKQLVDSGQMLNSADYVVKGIGE